MGQPYELLAREGPAIVYDCIHPRYPPLLTNTILLLPLILLLALFLHRHYLHPLAHIPSPSPLFSLTRLTSLYHSYAGTEASLYTAAVSRLSTPILRVAPNEVLIADGAALAPIYSDKGGFDKAGCYANFDIAGWPSLFSALDRGYRAHRAKAVTGLFSTRALREGEGVLRGAVAEYVAAFRGCRGEVLARGGGRMDVLDLNRRLAVDLVTGYLMGRRYGGLAELREAQGEGRSTVGEGVRGLSASGFVNALVGVGRFFFLPNRIFKGVEMVGQFLFETKDTVESMGRVDRFLRGMVDESSLEDGTYQGRLLKLGLTKDEVVAQCEDLIFAGTDSSGTNLSTFCWQLAKNPEIYAKVKEEVAAAKAENSSYDPQSLPYLRSCLRETLRLSMANPTRLPRVVPQGGWVFTPSADFSYSENGKSDQEVKSYFLPAGSQVSVQIHTLHHNPSVFKDPYAFNPDRWISSSPKQLEKMNRDLIPFSLGSRQCIARNLAMAGLSLACAAVVENDLLAGAVNVGDRIELMEWFNSKVVGDKVELEFSKS